MIKSSRLRWAGHIERSEENSLLSRIYRGHPGGKRCVGRPRKKWIEDVIEDLEEMGIRMWRRKAQDMGSDCEAGSGPKWSVTPKWMDGLNIFLENHHCF